MKVEGDGAMQLEGELDLDHIAKHVQNLFKVWKFNDQIAFSAEQWFVITETIKLIDSSAGSHLFERRSHGGSRFDDNATIFYERDMQVVPSQHNRPLYDTASIRDIELRWMMVE